MSNPLPIRTEVDPSEIYGPVIAAILSNMVLYIVGQVLRDNSIVDITWGFMFLI